MYYRGKEVPNGVDIPPKSERVDPLLAFIGLVVVMFILFSGGWYYDCTQTLWMGC